jgi:uncharacterized SAM-binding protein YcdF (DUF218 family)
MAALTAAWNAVSTYSIIALLTPNALHLLALIGALLAWSFLPHAPAALVRLRLLTIVAFAWTWLAVTPAAADAALRSLENSQANVPSAPVRRDDASLVVVLASGELAYDATETPRLDLSGWERVYGGVELWRHTGGRMLMTGGPAGSGERAIAVAMKRIAVGLGVPESSVLTSGESGTTREDLEHAAAVIQASQGPVWLVTSAAHMPRALGVARALHLRLQPHPVDYRQLRDPDWRAWVPDSRAPGRWMIALRELVGYLFYRSRGWAS